jgi:2-oxoisovalerate ferredoxin oxidoreductase beta subunit
MTVFYPTFARHDHGGGHKAQATHYCPGCGHGLVHKYLAEAIEALGVQDRTVAISAVGCSVFLYYYLDVGNTQAAHGRAPAVALGHKLANPDSIVVSYQGDGDLASIGLAEIVHAAQLGLPLTVVFVNNATYGMTGGQMAPTSLLGQKTATTPRGRGRLEGAPLRMAEMIAAIDGAVHVERVALFDARQRVLAKRAIRRALQAQVENRGFALVEVLAECPLHLGLTPTEAEAWVKDRMVPVFPLGVKKQVATEPWPAFPRPRFDPASVLEAASARGEAAPRFARGFPARFGDDVGLKLAGAGGDGAQTAALLIARAAINEGFDATHIPSYGPESRGGTSYADVRLAREEVLSPAVPQPHGLAAFNAASLHRFAARVAPGGVVVYDSSVIPLPPPLPPHVQSLAVPCTAAARDLGAPMAKNMVALGALHAATDLLPRESYLAAMRQALGAKGALRELNERAFARGIELGAAR